ncbi:MAG TPA: hypothetical protein VK658_01100 [Chryseolinea sp.]|nr:hypothetical protein [Chryseolinea sp.]
MVSEAQEVGVIHKRIIQNLAENPMVVCDISCRNANVMLELGIRLAFDKPTIIIKDSETTNPFDTTPIEFLKYPRDLRFKAIQKFKDDLVAKIMATHIAAQKDQNYSTFLKHFGEFKVPTIQTVAASPQEINQDLILSELSMVKQMLTQFIVPSIEPVFIPSKDSENPYTIDYCIGGAYNSKKTGDVERAVASIKKHRFVQNVTVRARGTDHTHLLVEVFSPDHKIEANARRLLKIAIEPYFVYTSAEGCPKYDIWPKLVFESIPRRT